MIGDTTLKERQNLFKQLGKESLANHVLKLESESDSIKMWFCGKPNSGSYHFRVISAPGAIILYGDVGDKIIMAAERDMIPWLKGAVNSPSYLISKISGHNDNKNVFLVGEAEKFLEEEPEIKAKLEDELHYGLLDDGHHFCREAFEAGADPESFSSLWDYDSDIYWTVECLKKFVELLNEQ